MLISAAFISVFQAGKKSEAHRFLLKFFYFRTQDPKDFGGSLKGICKIQNIFAFKFFSR